MGAVMATEYTGDVIPVQAPSPDKEYTGEVLPLDASQHDSSEYAPPDKTSSIKDKLIGALEVAGQQASGVLSGIAGLGGEAATVIAHKVPKILEKALPIPMSMGIRAARGMEAPDVKAKIVDMGTYQPKTPEGKKYADFINNPESYANPLTYLKAVGDFGETLKSMTDDPDTKAEIDLLYNAALAKSGRLPSSATRLFKYTMRGGEAARVKMGENLAAFRRSNVEKPTLGQVSEGGITKGAGGGEHEVERQAPQVAARSEKLADRLSATKTSEEAGNVLKQAIEGTPETETLVPNKNTIESPTGRKTGGWISDVRTREGELHDKWHGMVGLDTPVYLNHTLTALKELTKVTPGAEATTAATISPKIMDMLNRMRDDVGKSRTMPLQAVEALRRKIGELTDPAMDARLTTKDYNTLYGALKEDMGDLVARKGDKAKAAYNRAFEYSRRMHDVSENVIQPILQAKIPERAFAAAVSNTSEGASTIRKLFEGEPAAGVKGLNPAEQDVVKSVSLRKLGETDRGEFNPTAFATNWSRMHGDAKDLLFGKKGTNLRNSLEMLNQVVMKTKSTKTTIYEMRNYAVEHGMSGGLAGVMALAGHHGMAGTLLGFLSGGYAIGRLSTRPWFIKWLASASNKKPTNLAPMLSILGQQAVQQSSEDQQMAQEYINNIKNFDPRGNQQ